MHRPEAEGFASLGTARLRTIAPGIGVEVSPADRIGYEALEEHRGDDAAGHGTVRSVGNIGDIALEHLVIGVPERHAPERVFDLRRALRTVAGKVVPVRKE